MTTVGVKELRVVRFYAYTSVTLYISLYNNDDVDDNAADAGGDDVDPSVVNMRSSHVSSVATTSLSLPDAVRTLFKIFNMQIYHQSILSNILFCFRLLIFLTPDFPFATGDCTHPRFCQLTDIVRVTNLLYCYCICFISRLCMRSCADCDVVVTACPSVCLSVCEMLVKSQNG